MSKSLDPGYLLILRSPGPVMDDQPLVVPDRNHNPFLVFLAIETTYALARQKKHERRWRSRSPSWPREQGTRRRVTGYEATEVRQKDTETAVNDFLATFSSLYDSVPEEERGKVLDTVKVVKEGSESESDSRSTRSSSLADD
jgi:hypothetical protein